MNKWISIIVFYFQIVDLIQFYYFIRFICHLHKFYRIFRIFECILHPIVFFHCAVWNGMKWIKSDINCSIFPNFFFYGKFHVFCVSSLFIVYVANCNEFIHVVFKSDVFTRFYIYIRIDSHTLLLAAVSFIWGYAHSRSYRLTPNKIDV